MKSGRWRGIGLALGWFLFPLIPAILGTFSHQFLNGFLVFVQWGGKNPADWDWRIWLLLTGPLIGYGFLAGATLNFPDDPEYRGWKRYFARRSLWVAVGPWVGFLAWVGIYLVMIFIDRVFPESRKWPLPSLPERWWTLLVQWFLGFVLVFGPLAYGWFPLAWLALRRARSVGQFRSSLILGLGFAFSFVGSLFGSFWAITQVWRSYFFDPRIIPALLAGSTLFLMAGCATPENYGEVRRRELFDAMLLAWLLGLALAWRWWSRSRSKPPAPPSA